MIKGKSNENGNGSGEMFGELEQPSVGEMEKWGMAVPEPEIPAEPKRWNPTEVEKQTMAMSIVSGLTPTELASKMGKTYEQMRYQLRKPDMEQRVADLQENAMNHAGFALAQLHLACSNSASNLIALTTQPSHPKHFDALKLHLEMCLGSLVKQPEQHLDVNVNVTSQVAALINDELPKLSEARGEQAIQHPSNNTHLKRGSEIAESNQINLDETHGSS